MAIILKENWIGARAFLIGVILAVVIGLSTTLMPIPFLVKYSSAIYAVLVLLGLLVGFSNVVVAFICAFTVVSLYSSSSLIANPMSSEAPFICDKSMLPSSLLGVPTQIKTISEFFIAPLTTVQT